MYNASMHLHRGNLFLVGMPGCGKSTLGRMLARRLDKPFFDADVELERRLGVTIPVIFELEGALCGSRFALSRGRGRCRRFRSRASEPPRASPRTAASIRCASIAC